MSGTIRTAEAKAKAATSAAMRGRSYTRRSSGTRDLGLNEPTSSSTGYWENPSSISSKPPRWIVHLDATTTPATVTLAKDNNGALLPGAGTPGYINNGQGTCAVAAFRLMPAVKTAASTFEFPSEWEWIVQFVFPEPLPIGTSGDALTDFDPALSQIAYKGRASSKANFQIAFIALIQSEANPGAITLPDGTTFSYADATAALKTWLEGGMAKVDTYDLALEPDMLRLQSDIAASFTPAASTSATMPTPITKAPDLIGIPDTVYTAINAALKIGKRHFIFHGPPGTGKTSLAEYVAEQIAGDDLSEGEAPYVLLTASTSWTSQDLVGGYQPTGPGSIGFVPGVLLKNFHKPLVIDELNRCPIDKVIGPLFSILSGQSTTLPYRVDVADANSENFKILATGGVLKSHEFAPGPSWALICTMNQVDKSQLEQISFALQRRFVWIRVGVPDDLHAFVRTMLVNLGIRSEDADPSLPNPVAEMWSIVNRYRELGGAPIIDFLRLSAAMDPTTDFLAMPSEAVQRNFITCISATLVPLLDGLTRSEAKSCAHDLAMAWGLSSSLSEDLDRRIMEVSV